MIRKIALTAIVVAAPVALAVGWSKAPNSLWYVRGRPTRFRRLTNRAMSWLDSIGMPLQVTLDVPARLSGRRRTTVLVPAEVNGERYLVSMLGAIGLGEERPGRRRADLHQAWEAARDIPGGSASRRARPHPESLSSPGPRGRPHFPLDKEASEEEFDRIADQYPVFRVTTVATPRG